jgi:hypothetical protein
MDESGDRSDLDNTVVTEEVVRVLPPMKFHNDNNNKKKKVEVNSSCPAALTSSVMA